MDPHFLNLSLINSLRTGNVILDLVIAAMVPTLFVGLWTRLQSQWYALIGYLTLLQETRGSLYTRHVAHTRTTPFNDEVDDCANHVLQNAIRTYVGSQLPSEYLRGTVRLTEIKSVNGGGGPRGQWDSDDDDDNGGAAAGADKKDLFDSNGGLRVLSLPNTEGGAVEIVPGLRFQERFTVDENPDDNDRNNKSRSETKTSEMVYTLSSAGHGGRTGKQVVDDFLAKVMAWYTAEVAKQEDDSRWMYQPLVASTGADRLYKRYKLSSEKSFNSLFFQDKARVIKVLDTFANKTGKYEIKGFPHRLSMLLHGPPGTGKTSLVKAIALYTNRHVVSVPLSRMKTNQEFMDVMMDCVFKYCVPESNKNNDDDAGDDGGTKRAQLSFENIVFLLEDVDAASTVVHRKPGPMGGSEGNGSGNGNGQRRLTSPKTKNGPSDEFPSAVASPTAPVNTSAFSGDDDGSNACGGLPSMEREGTAAYSMQEEGSGEADASVSSVPTAALAATSATRMTPPPEDAPILASSSTTVPPPVAAAAPLTSSLAKRENDNSDSDDDAGNANDRRSRRNRRKTQEDTTEHLAKMCQMLIQQQGAANKKGGAGGGLLADLLNEQQSDALSLESILTVLDGVIDTPGRILVMTTNHPERLDPSLIRNGRINMKLYMGHLTSTQVAHMTRHYYPEAAEGGVEKVVAAFKALGDVVSASPAHLPVDRHSLGMAAIGDVTTTRISPAEFEQLCAECVGIDDLAARLTDMRNRPAAAAESRHGTPPCEPLVI